MHIDHLNPLAGMITDRWDPLSSRQTKNLAMLLEGLVDEYPTLVETSKTVQSLLNALYQKARVAINEDLFIPMYSKQSVSSHSCSILFAVIGFASL